ncbi:5-formyltetrahydrofolate cyclo-ligase [Nocardia sp. NRRL S-836]|uniref:5-formyltetrahydrofolate cyclo-ligase n=1 Tax=Nocardia sp. NRRL S-836 TaxID=1519492 RepID=UPI0006B00BF7|nr:5-formyltetrahydrofolate cyclo-ligase [Nocardia sp. NRRL S-836]KOV89701.1 5-formyltetrahydrofolate cyclo-ligase [Nocardia sp. NRRL S-836]
MTSDLRDWKATLRSRLLAERRAVPADVRAAEAAALAAHVSRLDVGADQTVCAFLPVGSEPGDASWLDGLRCRVLLPVVTGDSPLDWALHTGPSGLAPAALGLLEPTGPRLGASAVAGAALVLVPALAVSVDGVRLGKGKGHYDRSLPLVKAPLVAVVRDAEVLAEVPAEPHDVRMNGVLTPSAGLRWL